MNVPILTEVFSLMEIIEVQGVFAVVSGTGECQGIFTSGKDIWNRDPKELAALMKG